MKREVEELRCSAPAFATISRNVFSIDQEADIKDAKRILISKKINGLAVTHEGKYCGILTWFDINKNSGDGGDREILPSLEVDPIKPKSNKIFIVHGHNVPMKNEVADFLKETGLIPIILDEQPDLGKTVIEKVEYYLDSVSFALILQTRDDVGEKGVIDCEVGGFSLKIAENEVLQKEMKRIDSFKNNLNGDISKFESYCFFEFACETFKKLKARSRQNVIFELGITIGYLGRKNVRVLYEEGVELPTDIHGLVYIPTKCSVEKEDLQETRSRKFFS